MLKLTDLKSAKPLGTGKFYKSSSILDNILFLKLKSYKNRTCRKYKFIKPEEIYRKIADTKYYIAVRASDDFGNISRISTIASTQTQPHPETVPPANVMLSLITPAMKTRIHIAIVIMPILFPKT